jgi:hypothetical protein
MHVLAAELVERIAADRAALQRVPRKLKLQYRERLATDHREKWIAGRTAELTPVHSRQCALPGGGQRPASSEQIATAALAMLRGGAAASSGGGGVGGGAGGGAACGGAGGGAGGGASGAAGGGAGGIVAGGGSGWPVLTRLALSVGDFVPSAPAAGSRRSVASFFTARAPTAIPTDAPEQGARGAAAADRGAARLPSPPAGADGAAVEDCGAALDGVIAAEDSGALEGEDGAAVEDCGAALDGVIAAEDSGALEGEDGAAVEDCGAALEDGGAGVADEARGVAEADDAAEQPEDEPAGTGGKAAEREVYAECHLDRDDGWCCRRCTLINGATVPRCAACDEPRVAAATSSPRPRGGRTSQAAKRVGNRPSRGLKVPKPASGGGGLRAHGFVVG